MLFLFLALLVTVQASPNIILIVADDLGWSQTSVAMDGRVPFNTSSYYIETPNLQKLANAGMIFSSGYSPSSICTPSRRSILSGASTIRTGCCVKSKWIPAEHLTIPNALKAVDPRYQAAHFGKWGHGMNNSPEECGYDVSDGETENIDGNKGVPKKTDISWIVDNIDPKKTFSVTEQAVRFMTNNTNPFYLQVSYYAVHLSVMCSRCALAKYEALGIPDRKYTQCFAAMVEEMDTGVGQLLDALDWLNITDNTYVFFTSDNGGRGRIPGSSENTDLPPNSPLEGAKHTLKEGGVRVPFIVKGPGVAANSSCHKAVIGYDLLPTFVELAGGSTNDTEVDGTSIQPLLLYADASTFDRPTSGIYFDQKERKNRSAIRKGAYKLRVNWEGDVIKDRQLWKVNWNPAETDEQLVDDEDKANQLQNLLLAHYCSVGYNLTCVT